MKAKRTRTDRLTMLEAELKELRALARAASASRQFAAAASARAKILDVRREIENIHEEAIITANPDEVARLEMMIRRAIADGSHVAAKDLLKSKADAIARRTAAEAEAAERARRDPAAMRAKLVELLRSLPARAREELLAEVMREQPAN